MIADCGKDCNKKNAASMADTALIGNQLNTSLHFNKIFKRLKLKFNTLPGLS